MRFRRRCVVCGGRIRWWQNKVNVKAHGRPREVHRTRFYAGTTRPCLEIFAVGVETGMGDVFFDMSELQ